MNAGAGTSGRCAGLRKPQPLVPDVTRAAPFCMRGFRS